MAPSPNETDAALRNARQALLERGHLPAGVIHDLLARSWQRSLDAGLAPTGSPTEVPQLDSSELAHNIEHRQELVAHARPVMEYLHSQTEDSGCLVILSDDCGMLLHAIGDIGFRTRAERVSLMPGASWHECYRGTNAIGTALAEGAPVVVHRGEHYLERNSFLTCSAAPIVAPDGSLLGALDISSEHRNRHPHTLGLVRTATHMIENRLFAARFRTGIRLHFHPLAEGIGSVAEGVAALSEDGWILGANRAALTLLGISAADLGTMVLDRLLDLPLAKLIDFGHRDPQTVLPVNLRHGGRLFMRVERGRHPIVVSARPKVPPPHAADALAALDTGDARMHTAIERARKVLGKTIPLLLQGESGAGKEWFARAIHLSGPRRAQPFVALNCAALPENLIEAELFGYAPGAFTGARRQGAPGRIREAHGGTLLLDEIGDMPRALQTRLLRVLEDHHVVPLGSSLPVAVDFALICSTHHHLKTETETGHFRTDLYYRLNGLTLTLPSLRERSDFGTLVTAIIEKVAPGRNIRLDRTLMAAFANYAWPGNLRQLTNALQTACALLDENETLISWPHLPDDIAVDLESPQQCRRTESASDTTLRSLSDTTIRRALSTVQGNKSEAARRLGISRNTLYRRLKLSPHR
ncbi:MAG: sigma-54-dependent Fis family transcriptional regulator [Acidiferrobacter sp.]